MFLKPLATALTLSLSLNLIDFGTGSYSNMAQNPLILDMDFCTDVDDAVAVRMATTLDDMDVCTLVGVGLCTTDKTGQDMNLKAVHGLLTHDGHEDVPIGKAHVEEPDESPYWDVCASYSTTEFSVKDSVDLYKEILRSSYNKVTIVTTGYLTNIQYLLQDSEGYSLVRDNCERIVVTGGTFPSGRDNNFSYTAKAATAVKYVEEHCPVQIVYVPNDVGGKFTAGGLIQELSPSDLLAKSLSAFGTQDGRAAWDPTAVFIAAVPEDVSNFEYIPITAEFAVDGSHTFTEIKGTVSFNTLVGFTDEQSQTTPSSTPTSSPESINVSGYANDISGNMANDSIKTVGPESTFSTSVQDSQTTPSTTPSVSNNQQSTNTSANRLAVRYKTGVSAKQYQDMIEGIISYEYLR